MASHVTNVVSIHLEYLSHKHTQMRTYTDGTDEHICTQKHTHVTLFSIIYLIQCMLCWWLASLTCRWRQRRRKGLVSPVRACALLSPIEARVRVGVRKLAFRCHMAPRWPHLLTLSSSTSILECENHNVFDRCLVCCIVQQCRDPALMDKKNYWFS